MAWKDFPTKNGLPICSNFTLKKTLRYSESFQTFIRNITSVYFSPMFDSLWSLPCVFASYRKWILNFLIGWLIISGRLVKGNWLRSVSHFHSLSGQAFFSLLPPPPLPPTFPETTVENLLDDEHIPITREHTETPALQATIPLVWRAFSLDERIIVDGRPIRINKAAFSNFSWVVWTGLQYSITNQT